MKPEIQNIIDTIVERDSQDERRASATLSQIYDAIEELTEHPTCETCAHWGNYENPDQKGRKECAALTISDSSRDDENFIDPGTSLYATLWTKPNFYCKLHKPKEN